ncbi:MAG TPA: hypothetical protein VH595_00690 [Verrucomicrobiae bacterium]|jgi:hypothetical protein|nr:hypothetical protein [Verrucomicrobiae bacterium]
MTALLRIACDFQPGELERRVAKIAEFLGVPFSFVLSASNGNDSNSVVVAHWKTLATFPDQAKALFVYGWNGSAESNEALKRLTHGAVLGSRQNENASRHISVAADSSEVTSHWAGLDFQLNGGNGSGSFEINGRASHCQTFSSNNRGPFFARLTTDHAQLFLLAGEEIADLDSPAPRNATALNEFESLVPLMMFIRHCFREQCWHAPVARACFIIDDPLLTKRYGHLDYEKLLQSMERERYCASIAFIPWNYRRTDGHSAAFFKAHFDRYGLCVHGCNHIQGEFGGLDPNSLRKLASKALWRMERHHSLSGLPFAPVMVFPQGIFSSHAMAALSQTGYLSAVNTSPFPADEPDCLALRHLLEPAITHFSNFALFMRRYPRNIAEFALDLFVGKPLLIVEHHSYFRDDCRAAGQFGARLNSLAPHLEWSDLNTICSRSSLIRRDFKRRQCIRFFTDRFVIKADAAGLDSAFLYRRASHAEPPPVVTINSKPAEATVIGGELKIPISLEPSTEAEVLVQRNRADPKIHCEPESLLFNTRITLRRRACEFRDNVVDKSPWASSLADKSIKWLRNQK